MTGVLYRIAHFCVRRKFIVIAVWLVAAIALVGISKEMGDNTNDDLSLPGTNSQHATDLLDQSFPVQANGTSPIVLHATSGKLTDSKYSNAVNRAAADLAKQPDVASVVNPLTPRGRGRAEQGPGDRVSDRRPQGQPRLPVAEPRPRTSSTPRPNRRRRPVSRCKPAANSARRCQNPRPNPRS